MANLGLGLFARHIGNYQHDDDDPITFRQWQLMYPAITAKKQMGLQCRVPLGHWESFRAILSPGVSPMRLRERREREAKEEEESQCPRAWEYDKQRNEYYEILWIWFVQSQGILWRAPFWNEKEGAQDAEVFNDQVNLFRHHFIKSTALEDPARGERAWERSEKRKEAARKREKKENWRGSSCDTIGSVCFGWKYRGIGRTANRRPIQGRCVHG